jgi:hypothetical protein
MQTGIVRQAFIACFFAAVIHVVAGIGTASADDLKSFVNDYCLRCHGEKDPKADRRLDHLSLKLSKPDNLLDLRDVLDQLVLGEMPPKEARLPDDATRQQIIDQLTKTIETAQLQSEQANSKTVLRRLNQREYLNTIRDLFGFEMSMFDPTTKFPRDQTTEHMDNIGQTLVTSGFLLQRYLEAADVVVDKAFALSKLPAETTWTFHGPFRQQPEVDKAHQLAFNNRYMCLYECPISEEPEGAFGPLLNFREGVPCDGLYEVRVLAEAKNRNTPYDPKLMEVDLSGPLRLAVVPGNSKLDRMHVAQAFHQPLAETSLKDDDPEWHTFRVPLDAGFSPRFTFPNGMLSLRSTYGKLVREYRDLLPSKFQQAGGIVENRIALFSSGFLPHIRIHQVVVRGPLAESRPPASSRITMNELLTDERVPELLRRFADQAYRRPATDEEVRSLQTVYAARMQEKNSIDEAFQDALKSVLCSPGFLYLQPLHSETESKVSSHALASRLSYFLWSSMPDDELRSQADSGELLKPEILRGQVQRMLSNPKSSTFIESFLDSWLNLRALGDMPPAREAFAHYYSENLQTAMRRETFLFTKNLIDENLPITDFLDADYSFINRSLAKLYGMQKLVDANGGEAFRLVRFKDRNRGGVLGQGSVLTVTANGIETSPVIRGVWLLENILGTPPSPPPEDVPAIDPDVRGAKSIRDLLVKHRESAACQECHRKIDPLGFALENFDPIGQWRTHYEKKIPIDSSGELPSGESFHDLASLKEVLLERRDFFARMLTEKLAAYACGRKLDSIDRTQLDKIYKPLKPRNYPLRELIENVVLSPLFVER